MKLGVGVFITRLCKNVSKSLPFYEEIGYKLLNHTKGKNPQYIYSDGRMIYLLKQTDKNKTELVYFNPSLQKLLKEFSRLNISYESLKKNDDTPFRVRIIDPDGLEIIIQETDCSSEYKVNPRGDSIIDFGNFGEFALPTNNFDRKKKFWQKMGFESLFEEDKPYPWGIFSDGFVVLGLHQSADFNEPSLTYFKVDMKEKIQLLQKKGFKFRESEMAKLNDGNGITKSPDGQQFFFFEGDIK